jgi:hypothetical protein
MDLEALRKVDRLTSEERAGLAKWLRTKARKPGVFNQSLRQRMKRAAHNLLAIDRLKSKQPPQP